jgi:integrase/recombinase XerD
VLRPQAVRSLLALVAHPKARTCLQLLDACGLRRREGTQLQVSDIDAPRLLVRVRQGQGGKDRCVPLAPRVLALVRASWPPTRPRPWLFPARPRSAPLAPPALHKTFKATVRQRGLATDASMHPLRHASATPLRARGVSRRVLQALRGHNNLSPTARSTPLTPNPFAVVQATITALMADLYTRRSTGMPAVADGLRRDGAA